MRSEEEIRKKIKEVAKAVYPKKRGITYKESHIAYGWYQALKWVLEED